MIKIENLMIEYNHRTILEKSNLEIPEGKVTLLLALVDLENQHYYIELGKSMIP